MKKFSEINLLVVGEAVLDQYWFGDVTRISPEAPVPVVKIEYLEEKLGGAANIAKNIRSLGANVSFLTSVGDDSAAKRLLGMLDALGVRYFVSVSDELNTSTKLRVIARHQQIARVDCEKAHSGDVMLNQLQDFKTQVTKNDAVVFSDYGKVGGTHIKKMIDIAKKYDIPVFVDPKGADYSLYKGAFAITPNKDELKQIIGEWSTENELCIKVQNLRQHLDLRAVLLTRNAEGMTLFDEDGVHSIKANTREVYDIVGAGDSVISVFATMMCAGYSMIESMQLANKAAGIVVGKFGAASVTLEELFED